jgi:peptide/nickel transport system permease protein
VITFTLMHFTAGGYVPGASGSPNLTPGDIARIRANLGLDRPVITQYADWVGIGQALKVVGLDNLLPGNSNVVPGILEGDFGRSLIDGTPVISALQTRLPNTLELSITGLLFGLLIAIPVGVQSALHRGGRIDQTLTVLSVAGFAIPEFWFCLLLILLFSVSFHAWGLPWLPASGAVGAIGGGDFVDRLAHLVMPASVIAALYASQWSRFVRSSMIEVLAQDFIRTARAKGMSERRAIYVHALRNALTSLVTLVGLELPDLVSGTLVVEVVFNWPGIGLLTYQKALAYDYTTVMGITVFVGLLVVLGNLLSDMLYGIVDPRVRYA